MGACEFYDIVSGPNARKAFEAARSAHPPSEGYSGTIAEKNSFVVVPLPPRITLEQFVQWIEDPESASKGRDLRAARAVYYNKWGPALCLQAGPAEATRLKKERPWLRGRVYLFCGLASS